MPAILRYSVILALGIVVGMQFAPRPILPKLTPVNAKILEPPPSCQADLSSHVAGRKPASIMSAPTDVLASMKFNDLAEYYRKALTKWRDKNLENYAPFRFHQELDAKEKSALDSLTNRLLGLRASSPIWEGQGAFEDGGHQVQVTVFYDFYEPQPNQLRELEESDLACANFSRFFSVDGKPVGLVGHGWIGCGHDQRYHDDNPVFVDSSLIGEGALPMSMLLFPSPVASGPAEFFSSNREQWFPIADFRWTSSSQEIQDAEEGKHNDALSSMVPPAESEK